MIPAPSLASAYRSGQTQRRGGFLSAFLALAWLLAWPAQVSAHAELVRSDPALEAIVESSPRRIVLWFSEEPELRFSEIRVLDNAGRRLDRGDLHVDPADRLALSVEVQDAAPGTYTVFWRVLSKVDGHVTRGAFAFTVGLDQVPTGPRAEAAVPSATPERVIGRVLTYAGFGLLAGGFPFGWWVLLPVLRRSTPSPQVSTLLLKRCWTLGTTGAALALAAAFFTLLTQAAAAMEVPLAGVFGEPLTGLLFNTRFGLLWWIRAGLLAALLGLHVLQRRVSPTSALMGCGTGLGAGLLLAHALGSHSAAAPGSTFPAVAVDWAHLAAVVTWAGGLPYMGVVAWTLVRTAAPGEAVRVGAQLVPRFSTIASVCIATLVLTGLYESWLLVGSLAALVETPYGLSLVAKLALVTPLLALGAVNLLVIGPRLRAPPRRGAGTLVGALRLTVAAEILFTLGVLGVVGVLTNLQPGREALLSRGVEQRAANEDVRATLRVQPAVAGPNLFDVHLADRVGGAITDAEKVALRFTMVDMDMGERELVATHRSDGHYVAQGGPLIMDGRWRIEAVVRRPGRLDVRPSFDVPVSAAVQDRASQATPPPAQGNLILGVELALVGLFLVGLLARTGGRRRRMIPVAFSSALLATIIGALVSVNAVRELSAASAQRNPIPPTRESIARGGAIYAERCVICHGEAGRGDGPLAAGMIPPPADFRVHLAAGHTEAQLFSWLSNGVPGTTMPPFRDQLSETDRWHVLNFIQTSFGQSPPIAGQAP